MTDTVKEKSWRNLWEWRALVFIFRMIGVAVFVVYLASFYQYPWMWAELKYVRSQPLEKLPEIAEKALKENKPEKITSWIELRPVYERAKIVSTLLPFSGRMNSLTFVTFSQWAAAHGNMKDAVFWWQYTRYRLRFDALRCGQPDAIENMGKLLSLLETKPITDAINKNSEKIPATIQRVLDHDAQYPADNNPAFICKQFKMGTGGDTRPLPPEQWRQIRHSLRLVTEHSLEEMKKGDKH